MFISKSLDSIYFHSFFCLFVFLLHPSPLQYFSLIYLYCICLTHYQIPTMCQIILNKQRWLKKRYLVILHNLANFNVEETESLMFRDKITQVGIKKGTKEPGKEFDLWNKGWNPMEKISIWRGLDQNMLETMFNFTHAARRKLRLVQSEPTRNQIMFIVVY